MTFIQYFNELFEENKFKHFQHRGFATVRLAELRELFNHFMRLEREASNPAGKMQALKEKILSLQSDNAELHAETEWLRGLSIGVKEIGDERKRQISQEGWTLEHDDAHTRGEIAGAAACYILDSLELPGELAERARLVGSDVWPWHQDYWKPGEKRRELVKAGALIAAEIDRLERVEKKGGAA